MPIVEIKGKKVHYLELNEGATETLVMIHGLFTNLSVFYFNIGQALAAKYHVVMYDLRGHGMSEWADDGYDVKTMAADLIALMDELGIGRAHLFGYSFGGLIALYAALHFPERVMKMIILETIDPAQAKYTDKFMSVYGQEYLAVSIAEYAEATNLKPNRRQIDKGKKLYEHLFQNEKIREELISDRGFVTKESLDRITNPVLLLYADRSDCLPTGKMLHERIPHSVLKIGEGDHNIPIQNPKWITAVIEENF